MRLLKPENPQEFAEIKYYTPMLRLESRSLTTLIVGTNTIKSF